MKIVDKNGNEAETGLPSAEQTAPAEKIGLALPQVMTMRNAVIRLKALENQTLETPNKQAEIEGIKKFLIVGLGTHADEFIATWLVMHNEYLPLCKAWLAFNHRCALLAQPQTPAKPDEGGAQ